MSLLLEKWESRKQSEERAGHRFMAIRDERKELERLRDSFAQESNKFQDITFSVFYLTETEPDDRVRFRQPHHVISLWQYYGKIDSKESIDRLMDNIQHGRTRFGLKDCRFSAFAALEGEATQLFIRMAKRAAGLFSQEEVNDIASRLQDDLVDQDESGKPVFVTNGNQLAIWLNYILYHLSIAHPTKFRSTKVELDPFWASLNAVEDFLEHPSISRSAKTLTSIELQKFRVALSFPGEQRPFVSQVAERLTAALGEHSVFYDLNYAAQLARPNLDLLLQSIYHDNSDLIVVFLSKEYDQKEWCGLEWRAIRDLIKSKKDYSLMLMRFDRSDVKGSFSIDGYIDLSSSTPETAASLILERLATLAELQ
jgi:hypothetical protein